MDPITAGVAVGGANVAGNVISGLFARKSAKDQMAFQREMDSTKHQREVADLKAAGLNPILSAHGGGGSPGGAGYEVPNIGSGVESAVSTALDAKRLRQDIKESETRTWQNEADYQNKLRVWDYIGAQIKSESSNARMLSAQADQEEVMRDFVTSNPKLAPIVEKVLGRSGGIIPALLKKLPIGRK